MRLTIMIKMNRFSTTSTASSKPKKVFHNHAQPALDISALG